MVVGCISDVAAAKSHRNCEEVSLAISIGETKGKNDEKQYMRELAYFHVDHRRRIFFTIAQPTASIQSSCHFERYVFNAIDWHQHYTILMPCIGYWSVNTL